MKVCAKLCQSAGIGFAVPVATVARVVPQLIRFGRVKRAGLGVRILPATVSRRWGIRGVVLRQVEPRWICADECAHIQPGQLDLFGGTERRTSPEGLQTTSSTLRATIASREAL